MGPMYINFTNFLWIDCYNISIYKKGKVKDETSRKIRKPMEVKLSNDSLLGNARANGADLSM